MSSNILMKIFAALGAASTMVTIPVLLIASSNTLFRWKYPTTAPKPDTAAIFITGCSSGIGRAAVEHFLSRGYTVFATVRKEVDASSLVKSFGKERLVPVLCDVAKTDDVTKAKDAVVSELKKRGDSLKLVGVINNAGAMIQEDDGLSSHTLETLLNINVVGTLRVVETFLPLLQESRGRVINVGSYFGSFTASTSVVSYSASKFALEGLSDGMRRKYRPLDISVSLVKPGNIKTSMNEDFGELGPSVVLRDFEHALTSPFPQPRYWPGTITGIPCMVLCRLFQMTPERFGDKLLKFG